MRNSKRSTKTAATVTENVNTVTEPVTVPATVTIATPDPVASKRERVRAERDAIETLYALTGLTPESVPVKSLAAASGKQKPETLYPHANSRDGSIRQAGAALVCAIRAGITIPETDVAAGTDPKNVATFEFPRIVTDSAGIATFLENGCGRDGIRSGTFATNGEPPISERITVRLRHVLRFIPASTLRACGLIAS
jgi:hypothetical protein